MTNRKSSIANRIIFIAVAAVLLISVIISSTYSWLMKDSNNSQIDSSDYITISADAGLELNYGDENNSQSEIDINSKLPADFKLYECSSVDGRNFFFPTSDYSEQGDGEFVNDVETKDLVFREASANDKNKRYISIDFTLSSNNATDVWLTNGCAISSSGTNNIGDAIRVAFVQRDITGTSVGLDKDRNGSNSIVFDNNLTDSAYTEKNLAVKSIGKTGELISTEECKTRAFNEFYFGNPDDNALFHINAGEDLKLTMNVWLEGTDKDCTNSVMNLSDLNILIKFSTSYEKVRTIYFVDNTLEKWTEDDNCNVYAIDELGVHHRMEMSSTYNSDYTWSVNLPSSISQLRFARYNPDSQGNKPEEWNYWEAGQVGACSTYVAFGHSAGMWSNSFSGTTISVFDGTNDGWLRKDDAEFHVVFSVTDANDNVQNLDYKMSYNHSSHRYSIVIPSSVKDIDFKRMNPDQNTVWNSWTTVANRGNNLYYSITSDTTGYWGNRYIYIEDAANMKGDASFVAYFYGGGSNKWTGMHSKSTNDKGWYVAVVPDGISDGVVFTRYNPKGTWTNGVGDWGSNNVYNQISENLQVFGTNNLFKTTGWQNNDGKIYGAWYYTTD